MYLLTASASVQGVSDKSDFQTLLKYTATALQVDTNLVLPITLVAATPYTIAVPFKRLQVLVIKASNPVDFSLSSSSVSPLTTSSTTAGVSVTSTSTTTNGSAPTTSTTTAGGTVSTTVDNYLGTPSNFFMLVDNAGLTFDHLKVVSATSGLVEISLAGLFT